MSDSNCLFCQIVNGEIPCYRVYEDDHVLAFLDIHPCAVGHTIVIPKHHYANVGKLGEAEWGNLATALWRVSQRVETIVKADGSNIGLNNGPAAGQAVPHVHWHVIPRFTNDGGGSMHAIIRSSTPPVEETARLFQ